MTCLRRKDCVRVCEGGGGEYGEEVVVVVRQEFLHPTPFLWKAAVWKHYVYLLLCLTLSAHTYKYRPHTH